MGFFVMGSVCFMPNQGCGKGMLLFGAWCFITGSLCYIVGATIEAVKVVALLFLRQRQEEAVKRIERAAFGWLNKRRSTVTTKAPELERPLERKLTPDLRHRSRIKSEVDVTKPERAINSDRSVASSRNGRPRSARSGNNEYV